MAPNSFIIWSSVKPTDYSLRKIFCTVDTEWHWIFKYPLKHISSSCLSYFKIFLQDALEGLGTRELVLVRVFFFFLHWGLLYSWAGIGSTLQRDWSVWSTETVSHCQCERRTHGTLLTFHYNTILTVRLQQLASKEPKHVENKQKRLATHRCSCMLKVKTSFYL